MPYLYYKQEYEVGNGKKFGVLNVDSCLMLCSTFSYANDDYSTEVPSTCTDETIS